MPEEVPTAETEETSPGWIGRSCRLLAPWSIGSSLLEVATRPTGVAGEMVDLHQSLVAERQIWLDRLPGDVQLPYLFGVYTPSEVAPT